MLSFIFVGCLFFAYVIAVFFCFPVVLVFSRVPFSFFHVGTPSLHVRAARRCSRVARPTAY